MLLRSMARKLLLHSQDIAISLQHGRTFQFCLHEGIERCSSYEKLLSLALGVKAVGRLTRACNTRTLTAVNPGFGSSENRWLCRAIRHADLRTAKAEHGFAVY